MQDLYPTITTNQGGLPEGGGRPDRGLVKGHEKQEELYMEERGFSVQEFKSWFCPTSLLHDLGSH